MRGPTRVANSRAGSHARVVKDQQIARLQELREVCEEVVAQTAGCAIQHQHPARSALGGRVLGDEFFGQIEVEVGDEHYI